MIPSMYNQSGPFTENSTLYLCVYTCVRMSMCRRAIEMGVDFFFFFFFNKKTVKYVIQ